MEKIERVAAAITEQVEQVVFGKRAVIRLVLVGLFAEGHLLIEDVPGTAKTLLAKTLARTIGGRFSRLQCTPDLLPTEVTGSNIIRPDTGEMTFYPGPVFANILLADEINRATPRTQSALLEAMAERQVSTEGITRQLDRPFFVMATQNPIEHEGTFPLPEAQLDRFLLKISVGYPLPEAEHRMLAADAEDPLQAVKQILQPEQLVTVQRMVRTVRISKEIREYIINLASATRTSPLFTLGAGPRATKGLYRAAQALAAMSGRDYVLPDDVKGLYRHVFCHRVMLSSAARMDRKSAESAIEEVAGLVVVPLPLVPGRPRPEIELADFSED